MEFNDRRPRTSMRVATKNIQPGDHFMNPDTGQPHEVAGVSRGLQETPTGVKPGHTVTMNGGQEFTVNSNMKHTVNRLDASAAAAEQDHTGLGSASGPARSQVPLLRPAYSPYK